MTDDPNELVTVFEDDDPGKIATAEAMLNGEGIRHVVTNALSPALTTSNLLGLGPKAGLIQVQVRREDAAEASQILRLLQPAPEPADRSESPIRRFLMALAITVIAILVLGIVLVELVGR